MHMLLILTYIICRTTFKAVVVRRLYKGFSDDETYATIHDALRKFYIPILLELGW